MANPVCLSPLKFYDSVAKQNHRKSYAYGHISPLIMPLNTLDPFQFVLPQGNSGVIQSASLYNVNGKKVANIKERLFEAGITVKTINNYKVVMFKGIFPLVEIKYEGEYYIGLTVGDFGIEFYSEVFCFTNSLDDCLTIEYWNPEADFFIKYGIITFADNFKFKLRLRTELGKPKYTFEEETTKRLGYSFIESQVSSKVYKFNAILPEYLCDALRIIRLCSNKVLTSNDEKYDMITFDMDVDWQDQGDLASVNCEFQVDNIIVNLGGYSTELLGGDFNNDYDSDYSEQYSKGKINLSITKDNRDIIITSDKEIKNDVTIRCSYEYVGIMKATLTGSIDIQLEKFTNITRASTDIPSNMSILGILSASILEKEEIDKTEYIISY